MNPGTYTLIQDFESPLKYDKRFKGDWRRRGIIPAGTVFYVRLNCNGPYLEAFPELDSHMHAVSNGPKSKWRDLFSLLDPLQEKPSQFIKREYPGSTALRVLDILFKQGKITLQDVIDALEPKGSK